MTFDERVARWLRAKGVDEREKRTLEAQRPFIQGIVLAVPIISQFNDAKTLTTECIFVFNTIA